jgi:hypothetical protein
MLSATVPENRKFSWVTHDDVPAQVALREIAQVDPVKGDRAGGGIVEAGDQLGDGGLTGAGGADQGHGLAGGTSSVIPASTG